MGAGGSKRMTRREALRAGTALGAGLAVGLLPGCDLAPDAWPTAGIARPNIVYIFCDQHRADVRGAAGHPLARTPNLDRLAAEGVSFGRCYTNAPVCRPARASMMTGLYPRQHRVWGNEQIANPYLQSHVRRIRDEAGYRTAMIGKAHLHEEIGDIGLGADALAAWGFEESHEIAGFGQDVKNVRTPYTDWLTATTPAGEVDKLERLRAYVDEFTTCCFPAAPWDTPPPDLEPWRLLTADHLDRYTGSIAAQWIRGCDLGRPFYLQVNLAGPHDPFDATTGYRALFEGTEAAVPPGILVEPGAMTDLMAITRALQDVSAMTEEQFRSLHLKYLAKVALVDDAVGDVLAALVDRDLLDRTWIVCGADHGEMLGDHMLTGKVVFYEASVRVPLLIRPPGGLAAPREADALTHQLDATASILEMAGLGPGETDARSLLGAVAGGGAGAPGRDWVLSENYAHGMIRTARHKLVVDYRTDPFTPIELYDLEADPDELDNRAADPALAQIRADLLGIITEEAPEFA
jgi:choline-sulfatase